MLINEFKNLVEEAKELIKQESLFGPLLSEETLKSQNNEILKNDTFAINSENDLVKCERCTFHKGINSYFYGVGSPKPELLIISDMPGGTIQSKGRAFNIEAGNLFTKMLAAMNLKKEQIYITTIYKCFGTDEGNWKCRDVLDFQIEKLEPKFILVLGENTIKKLLVSNENFDDLRGKWLNYKGIPLLATYHPEILLTKEHLKRTTWDDLQKVIKVLNT
jgi:uracil-DNA glycosylase